MLRVSLAADTVTQKKVRDRLLAVVRSSGGLEKWLFTDEVLIDDSPTSHSHPVLTIGTGGESVKTDLGLLSVFVHEQIHWHLSLRPDQLRTATNDLKGAYPKVRVGSKEGGARDEESTYLHLLVCFLEFEGMSELIGKEKAAEFILGKPYYTWIYRTVVSDYSNLQSVVERHGLSIAD